MPVPVPFPEFENTKDDGRRHHWSTAEYLLIVVWTLDDRTSIPFVARRNGTAPRHLFEGESVAVIENDEVSN